MIGEADYSPPSPYSIPDVKAYLNSINYSPLYSLNLQFLKYLSVPNIVFTILGELISSYACLLIYNSSKKYFKYNKLALIFLGAHPILCLYSLKFCTENFGLLGVSFYLNTIFSEINTNKKIENSTRFKNIFVQLTLSFYRAQILPLFILKLFEDIKNFFSKLKPRLNFNQKIISIFFLVIIINILFYILYILNRNYIDVLITPWKTHYPFSFLKIKNQLCESFGCENSFLDLLGNLLALIIYLTISIITLTGARGRFIDLPWILPIGDFNLINNQTITKLDPQLLENFDHNRFILIAVLPLFLMSFFHLIGYFSWIKEIKKISWKLYLPPLAICFLPLLFFPYLRYFICLIPISCIGFANQINRFYKK